MAITKSDRDVGIMAHLRPDTKEAFRKEAERRKMSMSALLSEILEKWLKTASSEELEKKRSNRRFVVEDKETGIRMSLLDTTEYERIRELLPAIPGHIHVIGGDGQPTCGCKYKDGQMDISLPLESE